MKETSLHPESLHQAKCLGIDVRDRKLLAPAIDRLGVDALPEKIRLSHHLTGNELGMLGNLEQLPGEEELNNTRQETAVIEILEGPDKDHQLALKAKKLLKEGDVVGALKVLLA